MPPRSAPYVCFVDRAFVSGSRNTASGLGTVTLVTPIRIFLGGFAALPGRVTQIMTFVPEPGVLVLLAAGVASLILIARERTR